MSADTDKDSLIEQLNLKILLLEKELKHFRELNSKIFIDADTQYESLTLLDELNLFKEKNDRNDLSIADMIRETSESCLSDSGYTYDEKTGLYYNTQYGYYYDPINSLFYNPKTGYYYTYDSDTQEYKYHSKENLEELSKLNNEMIWKQGYQHKPPQDLDDQLKTTECKRAPCIRIIDEAKAELQIITCLGGSIGSAETKNHTIIITDSSISNELDFRITYDTIRCQYDIYEAVTCGRATIDDAVVSEIPQPIKHHSRFVIADQSYLIHIHEDYSTCDWCEPGQAKAKLPSIAGDESAAEPSKLGRMRIVNQLKIKYGLKSSSNPRPGFWRTPKLTGENSNYIDRAQIRRAKEKQEKKLEKSSETRVGIRMMEKMGWISGDALGATGTGITEPIEVQQRPNARAGIGCPQQYSSDNDLDPSARRRRRYMDATRLRYQDLCSE